MRIESSVTSISWIPSEAIEGMTKLPFDVGIAHFDDPPPDVIEDLGRLKAGRAVGRDGQGERRPGHRLYGHDGSLRAKSGMIDFDEWYRNAFGSHTPWGEEDTPALVTAAETAERQLSLTIMRGGAEPVIRELARGEVLVRQGEKGDDLFLLLDGVLVVDVDGHELGEIGPGAILGERAALEGGVRTSTLRAVTPVKVAVVPAASVDAAARAEVSKGHRREER